MRYSIIRTLENVALEMKPYREAYTSFDSFCKHLQLYERAVKRLTSYQAAVLLVRKAPGHIQAADAAYHHGIPHPVADYWRK